MEKKSQKDALEFAKKFQLMSLVSQGLGIRWHHLKSSESPRLNGETLYTITNEQFFTTKTLFLQLHAYVHILMFRTNSE